MVTPSEARLTFLKARGLAVRPAVRTKILACTSDATLDRWFTNALNASSVAEVLSAQVPASAAR